MPTTRSPSSIAAAAPTASSSAGGGLGIGGHHHRGGDRRVREQLEGTGLAGYGRLPAPKGRRCFIHRDYHPENTLWYRQWLTGIVDWTSASWGPAPVDTAHMRWNLALTYGLDVADEFLRRHRSIASDAVEEQRYWDVVTVLDLVPEIEPSEWAVFDLARLERYLESVLSR